MFKTLCSFSRDWTPSDKDWHQMHDPLTQKWRHWLSSKLKLLFCGRQTSIWEKIFSIHTSDKDPISRVYKEHIKLNSKETNIPIRQWAEGLSRYFNRDCRDGNKHLRKHWTPLAIWCSVSQLCPALHNPMGRSTAGFPVFHCLLELAQTHVHWVSDAIQPSHSPTSPSPPALDLSHNQGLTLFPMRQLFISGGLSIGVSASASVFPMNIQGLFPLGLTGLISVSEWLSRVFGTTVWEHQFFGTQLSFWSNSHISTWLLEKP